MMLNISKTKLWGSLISVSLLLLAPTSSLAGPGKGAGQGNNAFNQGSLSFILKGGYAHSESHGCMTDVLAEIQFKLSSNIRTGLSFGYLSDSGDMHSGGGFGPMSGGMTGGMMYGPAGGFSWWSHSFRSAPVVLSLYYVLPLRRNLDAYMTVGVGYYSASFRDVSTQDKNAFGSQAGIGVDFRVADRVSLVAEGLYRFVKLRDFVSELHPGYRSGWDDGKVEQGFWHFHHGQGAWQFHEEHEDLYQMMAETSPFNISLNGFSLRGGVKFSF